ncbi:ABC transporter ATP-binding protein [Corynebacterium pygosceleis]|uniref:ABC transporter ATP-binding protein n=1 Tax=Corynebacterium pygosceleis TaxID=2800406 RepID=A0A9Q4C8U5_9CORY|nr:ABC transporter ATP-binding protein [Corynebacterium pygosceleis]MCK7638368.1 ABC transporter ATP-binding protein [Corynebacterium pygosceleis]MCK7675348.1 ABC transporter ATP-binding protein [Corynebacterium pygosceleis]MCL0121258.1 ABC transporter ATP-binding protein [Corynebacterium pygosceleis]MCX7445473.1 ABC transporter ATP-binding protein [Corynebacterium pygosceleis]MCX7469031.1 ABC transporter ATP-binding protein [Corynebacterium pygosceleis]
MTDPESTSLDVHSLDAGYGKNGTVIRGVSVNAGPGTVTTLIGPNGCGKSTLLKTMARLITPTRGWVRLRGEDLHAMSNRRAAQLISLLPQSPSAPPGLTVGELVARGRHPYRSRWRGLSETDREVVDRAMNLTCVRDLSEKDIGSLSGGQRQRAWIAMTLAQDTPFLLLDEPTTYLDPAHAVEVLQLARHLAVEEGRTVVLVLHDLNLAARFSDNVVLMKDGRCMVSGPPHESIRAETLRGAYALDADVISDPSDGTPLVIARGRVS